MITPTATPPKALKLLDQVRDKIRRKHYRLRTEQAYTDWIKRFVRFHHKRHPAEMGAAEVKAFLTHLAVAGHPTASTQNQAKAALLFLYREVLGQPLPWLEPVAQAKVSRRLPVVLTAYEIRRVLDKLSGIYKLLAYVAGMRLMEVMRLRVKDIDFERKIILVRDGKGGEDRVTMLPEAVLEPLRLHWQIIKAQHQADVQAGVSTVYLPDALARTYPNANRE
jgi:integrase